MSEIKSGATECVSLRVLKTRVCPIDYRRNDRRKFVNVNCKCLTASSLTVILKKIINWIILATKIYYSNDSNDKFVFNK